MILTLEKFFSLLMAGAIAAGCSWTPRNSPAQLSHVNKGLKETSGCILAGLKKMKGSTIINSVNIVESGKVEEIIGTSDAYQLYIVRLTAENDNTQVEVFSDLSFAGYKPSELQSALSPCVSGLKIRLKASGKGSSRKGFTGE